MHAEREIAWLEALFGEPRVASASDSAFITLPREHVAVRFMSALILMCLCHDAAAVTPVFVDHVRVHPGDDLAWAAADFDDGAWPEQFAFRVDPQGRILWIRARVDPPAHVDLAKVPLAV